MNDWEFKNVKTDIVISGFYEVPREFVMTIHEQGFEWIMVSDDKFAQSGTASELESYNTHLIDILDGIKYLMSGLGQLLVKIPENDLVMFILRYGSVTPVEPFNLMSI